MCYIIHIVFLEDHEEVNKVNLQTDGEAKKSLESRWSTVAEKTKLKHRRKLLNTSFVWEWAQVFLLVSGFSSMWCGEAVRGRQDVMQRVRM